MPAAAIALALVLAIPAAAPAGDPPAAGQAQDLEAPAAAGRAPDLPASPPLDLPMAGAQIFVGSATSILSAVMLGSLDRHMHILRSGDGFPARGVLFFAGASLLSSASVCALGSWSRWWRASWAAPIAAGLATSIVTYALAAHAYDDRPRGDIETDGGAGRISLIGLGVAVPVATTATWIAVREARPDWRRRALRASAAALPLSIALAASREPGRALLIPLFATTF